MDQPLRMGDWLHCNACTRLPNRKEDVAFFFISCGYIVCGKCLNATEGPSTCHVCSKRAHVLEINHSLPAQYQIYFRNPKDLLDQYVKNLNCVIDFQSIHRTRLTKMRQEQQEKAMKYVMTAQIEIKKKSESEKKAVAERDAMAREVEKLRHQCRRLQNMLTDLETESHHRNRTPNSAKKERGEQNQMQFSFIATSTLLSDCFDRAGIGLRSSSAERLAEVFAGGGTEPSPIPNEGLLTTPDMLGFKKTGSVNDRYSHHRRSSKVFGQEALVFS